MSSVTSFGLLGDAIALTPARRRASVRRFFRCHPGTARAPLGCGRALVEFQDWQVASGRIGPTCSPWWSAVNGRLVLDLCAAAAILDGGTAPGSPAREAPGRPTADPRTHPRACPDIDTAGGGRDADAAVAAWIAYARAREAAAQDALWVAHQASLAGAVASASALLVAEPRHERTFAMIVLEVVDGAAHDRLPTDDGTLGALARRSYPPSYPVTGSQLARLTADLAAAGGRQSGSR